MNESMQWCLGKVSESVEVITMGSIPSKKYHPSSPSASASSDNITSRDNNSTSSTPSTTATHRRHHLLHHQAVANSSWFSLGSSAGQLYKCSPNSHRRHLAIEDQLTKDAFMNQKTLKILLLGGPECGKSTIFKQMKILHMSGFTKADLVNYRYLIHSNAIQSLMQLIEKTLLFNEEKELKNEITPEDKILIDQFLEFQSSETYYHSINEEIGLLMDRIWHLPSVQECFERRCQFLLLDSAKYFLTDIKRLSQAVYEPTDQDVLRARKATVGINEIEFEYRNAFLKLVDVGGQRSERRKWIHCFDNVNGVLFIVAMSGYDQFLDDDLASNRLRNSIQIFQELLEWGYFKRTAIIVFLNKMDIFKDKIYSSPLKICFPEYIGEDTWSDASVYIEQAYDKLFECYSDAERSLYTHFTEATDTKNVDKVFESCMDVVFKENMNRIGFC